MKIKIQTIPHKKQRYETIGDWYYDKGNLIINVSDMGDWRYEALVAIHELIEERLCKSKGISQEAVDKFDMNWHNESSYDESGDDPQAPYHKQHVIAGAIERLLALEMGVDWYKYTDTLDGLTKTPE